MTPSPFQIGQQVGQNFGAAFERRKDENAIESILSQAMSTGNPEDLQNSIGQILSQVSPERQGPAIQYLQNAYSNVLQNQKASKEERLGRSAATEAGYTYGAPAGVQSEQVKASEKKKALAGYGLQPGPQNISGAMQSAQIPAQAQQTAQSPFRGMTDDQLIQATGAPYKEISEPAKAEQQRRIAEKQASKNAFEPESEKLEAKRVSELSSEIENEYKAAQAEDMRLDRMGVLDKEGKVSTPLLIKALDFISLPIGILQNPATEEYRKLEADFTRDVSKVFPGGKITNYELMSYLKTIPSLMNSPEGRKAIIRNRKLMNEAKKIKFDEYKKIIKENNGKRPPNLGILLEDRIADRIVEIEDKFIEGISKESQKFQQPIRMIAPNGRAIDIPPDQIESALNSGAKFQ